MSGYLSFEIPKEEIYSSVFNDYTLGEASLLPNYFGELAPVNVFLGENNSGKSRFMREIMKRDSTRVFNITFDGLLIKKLTETLAIINKIETAEFYVVDVVIYPSIRDQEKGKEFLSLASTDIISGSNVQLKIDPKERLKDLLGLLSTVYDNVADTKSLLEFLTSDKIKDVVKEIRNLNFSLKRVAIIYKNLWDRYSHGFSAEFQEKSALKYSSSYGTLRIYTNEPARFANNRDYTKDFGQRVSTPINELVESVGLIANFLTLIDDQKPTTKVRTYIPTLRTARTLVKSSGHNIEEDMIESTIRKDYELPNGQVLVNTGLSLYKDIDEKKNSTLSDREEFDKFQEFLSETFFNGKTVQVVPNRKKTNILVAVNREERALPHLGDGIQAIILLLYPLFIAPKGAWFFIEEPETHLHPGFQRLFIKTIATHRVLLEKNLIVFLTTHSNHLLDFALDEAKNINLFTFRKSLAEQGKAKYQVQLTGPQELECLTALGVQNSSVFLSNCTIWVEGITDRIYLQAYLKAYLKHKRRTFSLLEGLHYSFLEYAGANVSHYTFGAGPQRVTVTDKALRDIRALSISNRIMLIADQDAGKETKHERLTSQQHAGFEYVVLPTREIENLLTPEVIVAALKKIYSKQADHFDAGQLKQGQYKSIYLARHLQGKFTDLPSSFTADSGTVASGKKRQFAEAAAEAITSWDMLSDDAKKLTEQVFKFIMGHNPRLGSN